MRGLPAFATLIAVLLLSGVAGAAAPAKSAPGQTIELFQGEIIELRVAARGAQALEGFLEKEPVRFFPAGPGQFGALIGADVEAKPRMAKLTIRNSGDGDIRARELPIRIKKKNFKEESFKVAAEFDQFTPELLARIRAEQERFARAYAGSEPSPRWELPFIAPLPIEVTSPFGYRRIINGAPRAPHSGTDLRAPAGTEVVASNHARVALTGDFYFAGKSVVLDHGAGLMTMYFHLSEIKVEEGSLARKGEVIGRSGMTGRVTGPHLHWAARAGAARIDPLELLGKLRGDQGSGVQAIAFE
jgi:murein DD-endopeptidase MepM/ murein hydrolase activator NlpD